MIRTLFFTLLFSAGSAYALDFDATPESVWAHYIRLPPPGVVTDTALRSAMEWRYLRGPMPRLSTATPYGIQLRRWDRVIRRMGFAVVADDYAVFLRRLRVEMMRDQTNNQ